MAFNHAQRFIYLYWNPTNILLDSDMNPKISGFGFSKQLEHEDQEVTQPVTEFARLKYDIIPIFIFFCFKT